MASNWFSLIAIYSDSVRAIIALEKLNISSLPLMRSRNKGSEFSLFTTISVMGLVVVAAGESEGSDCFP